MTDWSVSKASTIACVFMTSACCSFVRLAISISKNDLAFCTNAACLLSRLATSNWAITFALLIIDCCLLSKFLIVRDWKNAASFSATPSVASISAVAIVAVCAVPVMPVKAIALDVSRAIDCAHAGILGWPLLSLNSSLMIFIWPRTVALASV